MPAARMLCPHALANMRACRAAQCDGASFAGSATIGRPGQPSISLLGKRVRLAARTNGRAIVEETLQRAMELGLSSATDVLVSGCSAGGLAAMLSARGIEQAGPRTARMDGTCLARCEQHRLSHGVQRCLALACALAAGG